MKSALFALQLKSELLCWHVLSRFQSPARGNALVAVEPQTRQIFCVWWSVLCTSRNNIEHLLFRTLQNRICQLVGCAKYKKCRWLQWRGRAVFWNGKLKADKLRMWSVYDCRGACFAFWHRRVSRAFHHHVCMFTLYTVYVHIWFCFHLTWFAASICSHKMYRLDMFAIWDFTFALGPNRQNRSLSTQLWVWQKWFWKLAFHGQTAMLY